MKEGPLQFTKRQLQRFFFAPRFWAVIVAVGFVLGVAGPFGTFQSLQLLPRLAYWLTVAVLTFFAGMSTIFFVESLFWPDRRLGIAGDLLSGLVAGVPVTAVVTAINSQLFGDHFSWRQYGYCTAIAMAVSLVGHLIAGRDRPRDEAPSGAATREGGTVSADLPEKAGNPQAPLMARLPRHLRGRLCYMSMQDHYVDVHTDRGSTLVLMRLADAIAEAGATDGLRIHRSHWVALDAVAGTQRTDGRLLIRMSDGALLPVSRSFAAAVRQAGLV